MFSVYPYVLRMRTYTTHRIFIPSLVKACLSTYAMKGTSCEGLSPGGLHDVWHTKHTRYHNLKTETYLVGEHLTDVAIIHQWAATSLLELHFILQLHCVDIPTTSFCTCCGSVPPIPPIFRSTFMRKYGTYTHACYNSHVVHVLCILVHSVVVSRWLPQCTAAMISSPDYFFCTTSRSDVV